MSSGIVIIELLRSEVVYLHVNTRAGVLVFPWKNVIPARRSVILIAAERIRQFNEQSHVIAGALP
jgi:hypothetical protein